MPLFPIFIEPYLDTYNKCYKKVLTVQTQPPGPLNNYVIRKNREKLSQFQQSTPCCPISSCMYILKNDCGELFTPDTIPELVNILISNGYTVDYNMTKLFPKMNVKMQSQLLFYVSYNTQISTSRQN